MVKIILPICSILLACVNTGAVSADSDHDHTKRTHHVIRIDRMIVHPTALEISTDDVVVFINYTASALVQVRFPGKVADKISCATRPNFYRAGDGALLSRPIRTLEFALPCKLSAGEYDYSIVGTQGGGGQILEGPSPADPKGRIVVR